MKVINYLLDFIFAIVGQVFTFAMLHVKLSLALMALFLFLICFIAHKAQTGKIFGFWWQLNRCLDQIVTKGLIIAPILLLIELIYFGLILLRLYKGI